MRENSEQTYALNYELHTNLNQIETQQNFEISNDDDDLFIKINNP